jgi:hypothetical protein
VETKSCTPSVIFQKLTGENNRPIGENSPNKRKFAESCHPGGLSSSSLHMCLFPFVHSLTLCAEEETDLGKKLKVALAANFH